jgi:hypothetical protein
MPKMADSSKLLSPKDPQYRAWQQFLAETHEAGHRYNSEDQSPAAKLKYFVEMYDQSGALMVQLVKDHSTALACERGLDACAKRVERFFPKLLQAGDEQVAQGDVRRLCADLHQRLLRRSEHWKAEAHARHQALLEQTKQDTSTRVVITMRRRNIVRKYLADSSLTMDGLARRCRTTSSVIHGMIREDRTRFGPDSLARFLKAIGVSAEEWDGK